VAAAPVHTLRKRNALVFRVLFGRGPREIATGARRKRTFVESFLEEVPSNGFVHSRRKLAMGIMLHVKVLTR
jgi:hypothetical protein